MKDRWLYAGVAILALGSGAAFWVMEPESAKPRPGPVTIGPTAFYATTLVDEKGEALSLGRFQGRAILINFWATWCAPCRDEMPALSAAATQWGDRVVILGLSAEPAETVASFRREHPLGYPLATGRSVDELSSRLGNSAGVLPYSVLITADGRVVSQKVGPYTAGELNAALREVIAKSAQPPPTS